MAAVRDLASYLVEHGPFDSVLCFSLGAALINTLLVAAAGNSDPEFAEVQGMVRSAVYICAVLPQDWEGLKRGQMQKLTPDMVAEGAKINVRTVHAFSDEDVEYSQESRTMVHLCAKDARVEVRHSAGHDVPRKAEEAAALAGAMAGAMRE